MGLSIVDCVLKAVGVEDGAGELEEVTDDVLGVETAGSGGF